MELPSWWRSELPWESLKARVPLISARGVRIAGLLVHRDGQFGWNHGDWVNESPEGSAFHYGLDVIGFVTPSRRRQLLTRDVLCSSPLPGVVAYVGKDEHGELSIVVRHSPARARLSRFSFFGDLEEVYVKQRQIVNLNTPLGLPLRCRNHRFFHFAIGYELRPAAGERHDIYLNPGPLLDCVVRVGTPRGKRQS